MAAQIGQYALILALIITLAQIVLGLAARFSILRAPPAFGGTATWLQLIFCGLAVLALVVLPRGAPPVDRAVWITWSVLTLMTVAASVMLSLSLVRWDPGAGKAKNAPSAAGDPVVDRPNERGVLVVALVLASAIVIAGAGLVALLESGPDGQTDMAPLAPHAGGDIAATGGPAPDVMTMVDRLDARLKVNPHDPSGWEMLMRSRVNLGQMDLAAAAYRDATAAYSGDAEQLESFLRTARALGIGGT